MTAIDAITELTERVKRLEQAVFVRQSTRTFDKEEFFVDNRQLAQAFRAMLEQQGITGEPIGAEELQKRMAQLDLEPNEFSRGIIEMREE